MKKKLFFFFLLCGSIVTKAQLNPGTVTMPSPNAASLGVYGETPVSYFTGIPNISVPLHAMEEKGLTMPISLNYHAAGFRPDIHPSWLGMNWNLSFGGAITRTVKKLPDEWNDELYHIHGYFYSHDRLGASDWSATTTLNSLANIGWENRVDRQPDEFSFNFLGFSGKFFLDHQGKWRVQSNSNIKVICEEADITYPFFHQNLNPSQTFSGFHAKSFGKFTLIDDKGIKYTFGTPNAIEYSSSITPVDMDYRTWLIATSWFLVDITLPNNSGGIIIDYERGPFQSNFQYFEQKDGFYSSGLCTTTNGTKGLSGKVISPVYTKSIVRKSDHSRVDFHFSKSNELTYPTSTYFEVFRDANRVLPETVPYNYFSFFFADTQVPYYVANNMAGQNGVINNSKFIWFKLDSITLSAQDYTSAPFPKPYQRIKFSYHENANDRLKLLSVTKLGIENRNEAQTYSFNYYDGQLPNYLYNLSDHWGFANGRVLPINPSGGYDWMQGDMQVNRAPWDIFAKAGMLKDITYPTGGKSTFEYELNDYGKYLLEEDRQYAYEASEPKNTVGGLRVKKILSDDGVGNVNEKEYLYIANYNPDLPNTSFRSSGVLERQPKYAFQVSVNNNNYWISMTNSVLPLTSASAGIHVGYSEVVEKFKDGSYKVYKFTNHDNGYPDAYPVNTITPAGLGIPYSSREFERGHLLFEATFTADNKLVHKLENTYLRLGVGADSNFVRSVSKEYGGYCKQYTQISPYSWRGDPTYLVPGTTDVYYHPDSFFPNYTVATAYGYYVNKFLKEKVTETYYSTGLSGTATLKTETTYLYDQLGQVIKTTSTNSKGEMISKNFKYPYQLMSTAVYNDMVNKNMLSYLVESNSYKGTEFLESELTEFDFFTGGIIKPKQVKKKIGNGLEFVQTKYNRYSGSGDILEVEGADGVKSAYVWSYYGTRPVAKIIGADYTTVEPLLTSNVLGGPHQGEQGLLTEIDNLRTALPYAFVTTYLYDSRYGLKLEKDANSNSLSYDYDGLGRLIHIRDKDGNILKKFCYNYYNQVEECLPCPNKPQNWVNTGLRVCEEGPDGLNTGKVRVQQHNTAPCSEGYDSYRWVLEDDCQNCPKLQNWQPTGNYRCVTDASGHNTGQQEREERNLEPCSWNPYPNGQGTRWVNIGYNPSACPLPPPCDAACTGPNKRCVGGYCETGEYGVVMSMQIYEDGNPICVMYLGYTFSDGYYFITETLHNYGYCE